MTSTIARSGEPMKRASINDHHVPCLETVISTSTLRLLRLHLYLCSNKTQKDQARERQVEKEGDRTRKRGQRQQMPSRFHIVVAPSWKDCWNEARDGVFLAAVLISKHCSAQILHLGPPLLRHTIWISMPGILNSPFNNKCERRISSTAHSLDGAPLPGKTGLQSCSSCSTILQHQFSLS